MSTLGPESVIWTLIARNRIVHECDASGALEIFLPAPEVCVTRSTGRLSSAMARRWIETLDPEFRRGLILATFHDWERMTSYDSAARRALTDWVLANVANIASAHFLVSSRMVAMGVSTANLATTLVGFQMVAHTTRRDFELALRRAL